MPLIASCLSGEERRRLTRQLAERAFNSKLLIAQVLGRGLRIPEAYRGERPVVTVFNHDAWSSRIKHLVDEVIEIEKRVYSYPVTKSPDYNFTLNQIDYSKTQEIEEFRQTVEYEFTKGYITLVSQVPALERETTYVRATTGERRQKRPWSVTRCSRWMK